MFIGIGVIGVFTATVASLFFEHHQVASPEMAELLARLERIESKVELLQR